MAGRVDADVRAGEAIVAYGDLCLIENGKVEVGEETLSHGDLFAIVAVERLVIRMIVMSEKAIENVQSLGSGGW